MAAYFDTSALVKLLVDSTTRTPTVSGEVAERHALRGYDAVHLASALVLDAAPIVVAWDDRLRAGALAAGLGLAHAERPASPPEVDPGTGTGQPDAPAA